ncbi:MAG: radical SAM protein [Candidatus Paceibacterota bacterium]|jgi:radical SAM protein with 4Fe4S-binding SPASM domain
METKCGNRVYVQWHITEQCGNNCRHCYSKGKRILCETSLLDFKAMLLDIVSLGNRWGRSVQITLIGGDPLLHPNFLDFVDIINEYKNTRIIIAGNPETLTPKVIERLIPKIYAFQVSVDGIGEIHDWFRYQGSYKKTIAKIKEATKMGLRMHCMTTVSDKNVDQLEEIMLAVYRAGVSLWAFARYVPPVGSPTELDWQKYQQALARVEKAHKPFELAGYGPQKKDPLWYPFKNSEPCLTDNPNRCQIDGCGIGSPTFGILPDNTVMACRRHAGSNLGIWKESGDILRLLVSSSVITQLRKLENIESCKNCKYLYHCRGCRAIAFSVKGNIFDPDPACPILKMKGGINYARD